MKKDHMEESLTCNTCHQAHKYDVTLAAVETCLECHDDNHSLAYKKSKHYDLWLAELSSDQTPEKTPVQSPVQSPQKSPEQSKKGTGVSCASCHMPRIQYDVTDWLNRVMVQHNQKRHTIT